MSVRASRMHCVTAVPQYAWPRRTDALGLLPKYPTVSWIIWALSVPAVPDVGARASS